MACWKTRPKVHVAGACSIVVVVDCSRLVVLSGRRVVVVDGKAQRVLLPFGLASERIPRMCIDSSSPVGGSEYEAANMNIVRSVLCNKFAGLH